MLNHKWSPELHKLRRGRFRKTLLQRTDFRTTDAWLNRSLIVRKIRRDRGVLPTTQPDCEPCKTGNVSAKKLKRQVSVNDRFWRISLKNSAD